jgi:transposase-like protein
MTGKGAAMNLNDPIFTDETKARAYFESIRWPNGPVCPHCGGTERCYRLEGKSTRPGLIHCNDCHGSFTVTTGGVMESSKIPLTKWSLGFRLYAASKKGFSAHQLHRSLGITYKSAWFMAHRIREAMTPKAGAPFGSKGTALEADETFIGRKAGTPKGRRAYHHKNKIMALVERETGEVRSKVINAVDLSEIGPFVRANVAKEARLMTDEARHYMKLGREFAEHGVVTHGLDEYVRGDTHTNTSEGVFSVFKRGMIGTYQHCSERHLHRYVSEFDFRYSNREKPGVGDTPRTTCAIKGAEGKRLTYRQPHAA